MPKKITKKEQANTIQKLEAKLTQTTRELEMTKAVLNSSKTQKQSQCDNTPYYHDMNGSLRGRTHQDSLALSHNNDYVSDGMGGHIHKRSEEARLDRLWGM